MYQAPPYPPRLKGEGEGKMHPWAGHESLDGEYTYSSTFSLTLVLDGLVDQRHGPAALPLGKTHYALCRRLDGPQGRSGRVRKISHPPEFDPRTVKPVASRWANYAIPAHIYPILF
jgi:hypothetical protein